MYTPINHWSEEDRPREKLLLKGKSVLTDSELLAIIIGSGSRNESAVQLCERILEANNNYLHILGKMSVKQLMDFKGIGQAKAISIVAAIELGRRRRVEDAQQLIKVESSRVVFEVMQPIIGELPHEEFWILCLNNANNIVKKVMLSKGGINQTIVDQRLVFKVALEHESTGIVICHNHPSGQMKPSESDIKITQLLQNAGRIMQIPVIDHVIIGSHGYYSFGDEGDL
jgi:DNA repair protein RadC